MGEKKTDSGERQTANADDAEWAREARSGRKFSLAEAIGRLGGGDLLKGASPVTRKRQVELATGLFLEEYLVDSEGALRVVLGRRVRESMRLTEESYDHPLLALTETVEHILGGDHRLQSFVGQVDAEWGRIYLERPHFERAGQPPHRDDPYTFASVRDTLSRLLDALRAEQDSGA